MNNRITTEELNGVLGRYTRAVESLGMLPPSGGFQFQWGSKVNGQAYRLYTNGGSGAPGTANGYLGMTRREAWDTLHTIAETLEDVFYFQQQQENS